MSERWTKEDLVNALDAIPIFPLPHVILFPEVMLPLHVFEPRYRKMLEDCLATHGALVIANILSGEDERGRPRIAPIAGGGIIAKHQPLADGRSNIVVRGQARLRLEELDPHATEPGPYRIARATILDDLDVSVPQHDRSALVAAATMFASEVKRHDATFSFNVPPILDAAHLADLCAFHLIVDAEVRQAVLEELDPRVRVALVLEQLAFQHGAMMRTDSDDGERVLN